MLIQVLKSKLKEVVVTDANVEYNGSLKLDPDLMKAAFLREHEVVHVNSKYGKGRITTYVIKGEQGTGQVELNGGAANFFSVGESVHVNCYALTDHDKQIKEPRIVITKGFNEITEIQ